MGSYGAYVASQYEDAKKALAAKDAEIERLKKIIEKMEGSNEVLYMGVKQADARIAQLEEAVAQAIGVCDPEMHPTDIRRTRDMLIKVLSNPVAAKAVDVQT